MDALTAMKQALLAMEYSEGGWAVFNPVITNLRATINHIESGSAPRYPWHPIEDDYRPPKSMPLAHNE